MIDYDVLIVGAGAVGLAIAQKLASEGFSVLIVERHSSFAYETSSRNSEVIHAGIYYPDNSLKAHLCVKGNRKLYQWAEKYGIPYRKTGKYIIATNQKELSALYEIYQQGLRNDAGELRIISQKEINISEPHIIAEESIWSPETGIIDSHKLMESFIEIAGNYDCDFAWKHTLKEIIFKNNYYKAVINDPEGESVEISVKFIINSAGLEADKVAECAGIDIDEADYRIHYCRGHYFKIRSYKKHIASHLIYPVPPADNSSLGIHITLDLNGELKLGPDSEYLNVRVQDYSVDERLGDKFYSAASRYIKDLQPEDLYPDQSGIRPKLQKEGGEFRDFIISEESEKGLPGLINLIGIESPGLTSSLEIADYIMKYLK